MVYVHTHHPHSVNLYKENCDSTNQCTALDAKPTQTDRVASTIFISLIIILIILAIQIKFGFKD